MCSDIDFRRRQMSPASSDLGTLRDICGNCRGLARLALPCGGMPAAILYIHLGRLRIRNVDGNDIGQDIGMDILSRRPAQTHLPVRTLAREGQREPY